MLKPIVILKYYSLHCEIFIPGDVYSLINLIACGVKKGEKWTIIVNRFMVSI